MKRKYKFKVGNRVLFNGHKGKVIIRLPNIVHRIDWDNNETPIRQSNDPEDNIYILQLKNKVKSEFTPEGFIYRIIVWQKYLELDDEKT